MFHYIVQMKCACFVQAICWDAVIISACKSSLFKLVRDSIFYAGLSICFWLTGGQQEVQILMPDWMLNYAYIKIYHYGIASMMALTLPYWRQIYKCRVFLSVTKSLDGI